ncbi:hypothetical protein DM02DRAFT_718230 [Periconia macrospinosa]|uniref:DUF3176 domain-containing protein n=1 Tax=Periconia macrospinosa TaxID=97972 RepID=A0A2V1DR01_9PLEO|nr:hypothetical protein DM02DRAFT_718230 [Periconia macrospinosa]
MATPRVRPSYTRVDENDPTRTSKTSTGVELRSLHDQKKTDEVKRNTKVTPLTFQLTSLPLQGPAALLAIILLTGAAVGVLLASRGSPIERWRVQNVQIQPQVWLSVLSTIMDGLAMFAVAKAAEMTYWCAAARGATLRKMYYLYESHFILGALKNLFHFRGDGLAVVSVLCFVSALRGPLFQRASTVDGNTLRHTDGKQELKVAQLIPPNFLFQGSVGNPLLFDGAYNAYVERKPINITYSEKECGDKCEGRVKGYGFEIKCSDVSYIPWDNSPDSALRKTYQGPDTSIGTAVPIFNSSADLSVEAEVPDEQQRWFRITNLFKPESGCGGNLSIHKCALHHAVVEYGVVLSNGFLSLSENWQDDSVLFQTPMWSFPTASTPDLAETWSPTAHWASWFNIEFNEEIDIYTGDTEGGPFSGSNMRYLLAKRFIHGDINNVSCSTTFEDPTQFVLNRLREIAFRTAVAAANVTDPVILFGNSELVQEGLSRALNWTQNVELIGQRRIVAYTVSIPYLACAIACSLLAVVAIVPLYWKARSEILVLRSFNPLDVAHVFGAPLLQDVREKDMESYVRKYQGLRRVRYSSKESDNGEEVGVVRILPEDRGTAAVAE